jgi:hypothetical protein
MVGRVKDMKSPEFFFSIKEKYSNMIITNDFLKCQLEACK